MGNECSKQFKVSGCLIITNSEYDVYYLKVMRHNKSASSLLISRATFNPEWDDWCKS